MERLTGVPKARIMGRGPRVYALLFHGRTGGRMLMDMALGGRPLSGVTEYNGSFSAERYFPALPCGGSRFLSAIAAPLRDRRGRRIGAVESIRDITEKKSLEDQLRRLNSSLESAVLSRTAELSAVNEELRRRNEAKARFFEMVVHDVRTPLNAIAGFASLLKKRSLPAGDRRCLEGIGLAAGQLSKLVADLTCLPLADNGRLYLRKKKLDVSAFLADLLSEMRALSTACKVRVVIAPIPPGLAARVDPVRFTQLVNNLFDNAVKFSPAGGRVRVRVARGPGCVKVSFADSGPGVPPDEREKIFDKYYQGSSASGRRPGCGLGLYIARAIASAHGGHIGLCSSSRGSSFWFTVPLAS